MQKDISIVVPLNNEEEIIGHLYSRLKRVLDDTGKNYEIIFVDDGSKDGTYENLCRIYAIDKNTNVLRLDKNYGQTTALAAGIDFARGEVIFTMDGDFQHDPSDIPKFLEKIYSGYDMVSGWRKKRSDNLFTRRLPSLIVNKIIGLLFNVKFHDISSTYRAYCKDIIKGIGLYGGMHRFIPLLIKKKIAFCEIEIEYKKREYGYSHYNLSRIGRVITDIFLLWIERWRISILVSLPNYSIAEIKSHYLTDLKT